MRKSLLNLIICIISTISVSAQIIAPDTACINTNVSFDAIESEISHTWVMDTTDISQFNTSGLNSSANIPGFSTPVFATMNNDNGNWYSFVTNYNTQNIVRLSFGNNPLSTPTVTNLGNFSFTGSQLEGIHIVKDSATGNWYGFCVNYSNLMRLSFGTSLSNTPTATIYNFSSHFAWAHQIGVSKYGNQWVGFVANRSGNVTRLDFGTSITNTPSATNLPKVGSYNNPCNFAIHQQNGNWYMLVTNLINATVTRLNFGTNIQNNSPTGTLLGGTGLNLPRGLVILSDCNQLISYIVNESGNIVKLDFHNDITSTPTFSTAMNTGLSSLNSPTVFIYNSTVYLHLISFSSSAYHRKALFTLPSFNTTTYYNPAIAHSFNTQGKKDITLLRSFGEIMGSSSYCDNIFISAGGSSFLKDSTICNGDSIILDASATGATTYNWSTGATSSSIKVKNSGKYWVSLTGAGPCFASSDSATITVINGPNIDLGVDTNVCIGDTLTLRNIGTSTSTLNYKWFDNSTDTFKKVYSSGTYWVEVNTNNACFSSDSITVTVNPKPIVNLGADTFFCDTDTITLSNINNYPTATYTWNGTVTGGNTYKVYQSGLYTLTISVGSCLSTDTLFVQKAQSPDVDLGPDTVFCEGDFITLESTGPLNDANTFSWNNGFNAARINVSVGGTYWLEASIYGKCIDRDTIVVTQNPTPKVDIGSDTVLCLGDTLQLQVQPQPSGSSYLWSDNSTGTSTNAYNSGQFSVIVTNSYNCTASDTISIQTTTIPEVKLPSDTMLCRGDQMELYAGIYSGATYAWNTGSTKDRIYIKDAGYYYVRVSNACGTGYDEIKVDLKNCDIWFPNAFTPNSDGTNDIAKVLGNINDITSYKLSIYNRWGQRVFYTEDVSKGWNGQFNNVDQPIGMFVYMIQYKMNGIEEIMKGNITLIR